MDEGRIYAWDTYGMSDIDLERLAAKHAAGERPEDINEEEGEPWYHKLLE